MLLINGAYEQCFQDASRIYKYISSIGQIIVYCQLILYLPKHQKTEGNHLLDPNFTLSYAE